MTEKNTVFIEYNTEANASILSSLYDAYMNALCVEAI